MPARRRVAMHVAGQTLWWVSVCSVALSLACKPRVGDRCSFGHAACTDRASALFCGPGGAYAVLACDGHDGCRAEGDTVSCDQSVAAAGDACMGEGYACSQDGTSALACRAGRFAVFDTCKGRRACKVFPGEYGEVVCDDEMADPGDPCRNSGDRACSTNRLAALECTDGRMMAKDTCRGLGRCRALHPSPKEVEIDCQTSTAAENEPCLVEGKEVCTLDGKAMLTCIARKYASPTPCPGGCAVPDTRDKMFDVTCDTGAGP